MEIRDAQERVEVRAADALALFSDNERSLSLCPKLGFGCTTAGARSQLTYADRFCQ